MLVKLQKSAGPIAETSTAIEGAFLHAGEGLSRGLDAFARLKVTMGELAVSLASGSMDPASTALDILAQDLLAISQQIPEDLQILDRLVTANDGIAKQLERLLDHIRMMTIISRSARIEAVVFDETLGLRSFTDEINALTSHVNDEIKDCARLHARMVELLRGAAKAQNDLDRDYREKLSGLATDLRDTFAAILQRRQESVGFVEELTAHSARIADSAGMALISLQSGDSIRQRLEHVAAAVTRATALQSGDGGQDPSVPSAAQASTARLLCRLQEVQLDDTVSTFAEEGGQIEDALALLIDDTRALIDKSRQLFGGTDADDDSFMTAFHERLANAARFIRTCEAARRAVTKTIADLLGQLTAFEHTITTLNDTTLSIVLIGVNAGLKAVRLGPAGRSLVVIADELKLLANAIARDAHTLLPMFTEVQDTCAGLRTGATERAEDGGSVDQDVVTLLGELDRGRKMLDASLKNLHRDGEAFEAALRRARADIGAVMSLNDGLTEAVSHLAQAAALDLGPEHPQAAGFADAIVAKHYTMVRERDLHAEMMELAIAC